jgi:hypothetical protein
MLVLSLYYRKPKKASQKSKLKSQKAKVNPVQRACALEQEALAAHTLSGETLLTFDL